MNKENLNGWGEYQKLVLSEIERHDIWLSSIENKVNEIKLDIAMLKVKSGIWGLMGGLIPVIIYLIAETIIKKG